jgi:anti-sigma factor ChrR (cupin superfamily)
MALPLRAVLAASCPTCAGGASDPAAFADLFRRGAIWVRLLKGAPCTDTGAKPLWPRIMLVLAGGFTDEAGSYGPGGLQVATPEIQHNPVTDPSEGCINLSVTTAPLKFKGFIPVLASRPLGF